MALSKIKSTGIADGSVSTSSITDGTIVNADINASANIAVSKVSGAISSTDITAVENNIALLGFKMAVNDGLTIFNLVDGVVDEFNDETGTDESEGSNDTYNATDDYYINSDQPDGLSIGPYSAGFSMTSATEPDTSSSGTNPDYGSSTATFGSFTVPAGLSSVDIKVWGAGGGSMATNPQGPGPGGGGGYVEGTLAVTPGQVLYVSAGEGGKSAGSAPFEEGAFGGGINRGTNGGGNGGGMSGVVSVSAFPSLASVPEVYLIAGSGGSAGASSIGGGRNGGAGGGLTGDAGGSTTEQTASLGGAPSGGTGGGGDQEQGGQGGTSQGSSPIQGQSGTLFQGGDSGLYFDGTSGGGSGGSGLYGGGGGSAANEGAGGGGSSYHGNPNITSGSTEEGSSGTGGGTADPDYVAGTNEGAVEGPSPAQPTTNGEDGYVLITGGATANTLSSTVVSSTFTATSEPSTARIVVFQENVDTPTLNTDIIASVSRDGTNFSNATLSDSGYITGSSGQRILTGTVDVSGQPTGTSMRWKLALANNAVKIHGVSLQWK